MKGCQYTERREIQTEKENSSESLEGQSASGSCDKAPTQQLDPAVDPSSNIYPLTLRGRISFTLPVSLSLFVSLYSYSLVRPDFLSFSTSFSHTAVSPLWSSYTSSLPPRFPLEWWHVDGSRWEQHICLPGDTQASLEWREHTALSDQAQAYPIWWCNKEMGVNYQQSEVRLQVRVLSRSRCHSIAFGLRRSTFAWPSQIETIIYFAFLLLWDN